MEKIFKVYFWKCSNCNKQVGYKELIHGECPFCKSREIVSVPDLLGTNLK